MSTPKTKKPAYASRAEEPLTARLLRRAHSPSTASSIHADKIKHKPLILHAHHTPKQKPTLSNVATPTRSKKVEGSKAKDARELRREARNAKLEAQGKRRQRKPQPLSAKEKRKRCFYDIPKEERKFEIFEGLNALWCQYMRDILRLEGREPLPQTRTPMKSSSFTPQVKGPLLVSADYHGAELEVVRSRSVSRVGLRGIVVRDTKFTFTIITKNNEIKVIPKEHSTFRFRVPMMKDEPKKESKTSGIESDDFLFELRGDQFKNRAPDRASKKFKMHIPPDL